MSGVSFEPVSEMHAEQLFTWRQLPHVAINMATSFQSDFGGHLAWLKAREEDPDYAHWVVHIGGAPVGLVNLQLDPVSRRSGHWGYYIGNVESLGFGALVPPFLYNALFLDWSFKALHAEVLAHNRPVMRMNEAHGYERTPDQDRVVEKEGNSLTLKSYVLTDRVWKGNNRYHRFRAEMPGLDDFLQPA